MLRYHSYREAQCYRQSHLLNVLFAEPSVSSSAQKPIRCISVPAALESRALIDSLPYRRLRGRASPDDSLFSAERFISLKFSGSKRPFRREQHFRPVLHGVERDRGTFPRPSFSARRRTRQRG